MKALYSKIETIVANVAASLKQQVARVHFNREPIFFTILELIKTKVSAEERITVLYVFTEIEKTLSLLRSANAKAYVAKFDQTHRLYQSLDEKLQLYLGISFYPMRSYYWYIQKKYKLAEADLQHFFTLSKVVFESELGTKTLAICEQHLNLFRIYFSAAQYDKARETAKDLLLLAMYGIENPLIEEALAHEAVVESQSWQAYLIDSLFRRYLYDQNHEAKLIGLVQFMRQHIPEDASDGFSLAIKALHAFYERNLDEELHYLSLVFDDKENKPPNSLFYILLSPFARTIKKTAPEFGASYVNSVNDSCKEPILKPYHARYIRLLDWDEIDGRTQNFIAVSRPLAGAKV